MDTKEESTKYIEVTGFTDEELDIAWNFLHRCSDFALFCNEQMGPNGVFIHQDDFLAFFPDPEQDFGNEDGRE